MVERNPPDATFGWGVVFSEETLGGLREADMRRTSRSPRVSCAGTASTSTTTAGCCARAATPSRHRPQGLLGILQGRCHDSG